MASLLAVRAGRVAQAKKKMLEAGAVSPKTAKTANELGVDESIINTRAAMRKGITATDDGRYYVKP